MPETTPSRPWRLERYRDGDEQAILGLFREVFGRSRSPEHWRWQFKDNPYGGPFVSLARRIDDGAVVGSYSVMPVMLNVMGKAVLACQSVDTAVHPDHRGQRVFEQTASDCYAWCESGGVKAVFGFPNASSYPGFMRTLDWRRIGFPVRYAMRLEVGSRVRRATGLPLLPGLADFFFRAGRHAQLALRRSAVRRVAAPDAVFRVHSIVPDGYDALWNECRSQEVLSVWKDADYLRWRYDRNPDHRFTYFTLARGDGSLAQAVGVEIDGTLALCELLVAGRDVLIGQRLALEICLHARSRGLGAVSLLGSDAGFFDEVFAGFSRRRSYADVFCGRSFDTGVLREILPHAANWTVTFGDGDFV
jgi:predicted N-acetyltransferase YhbS